MCPKCKGQMKILAFVVDEEVTRLPRLCMTYVGYGPLEKVRVIKLVIGCQGQWRAGKKDTQALLLSRKSKFLSLSLHLLPPYLGSSVHF